MSVYQSRLLGDGELGPEDAAREHRQGGSEGSGEGEEGEAVVPCQQGAEGDEEGRVGGVGGKEGGGGERAGWGAEVGDWLEAAEVQVLCLEEEEEQEAEERGDEAVEEVGGGEAERVHRDGEGGGEAGLDCCLGEVGDYEEGEEEEEEGGG